MAKYRSVQMSFWKDTKILDHFTPDDKLMYLYLMTNPSTSICGCYEISKREIMFDTGYDMQTVEELLSRLENTHNVIRYSSDTGEVLILNWYKHNWIKSIKVQSGVLKGIENVKDNEYRRYLCDVFSKRYGEISE